MARLQPTLQRQLLPLQKLLWPWLRRRLCPSWFLLKALLVFFSFVFGLEPSACLLLPGEEDAAENDDHGEAGGDDIATEGVGDVAISFSSQGVF